jgi:hypothetical protein
MNWSTGKRHVSNSLDDGPLLAALRAAIEARAAVPAAFIEAGRNAYAWHNITAELAGLSYDSLRDAHRLGRCLPRGRLPAPARGRPSVTRACTSAHDPLNPR